MTLVVTVNGPETLWLLADRRLTYERRPPTDNARKMMFLETKDAVAILGYAGLGATALGTEPADWMSAVLRTRNLPLEQSLGVLADAMKKQLPRHVASLRVPGHNVIVPAFVGDETKLYTIDLVFAPDRRRYAFRYTRHATPAGTTPRLAIGGSGLHHLIKSKKWVRPLLRLVRAHDRGLVSPDSVADYLARLNHEVHLGLESIGDKSVGPRCIVSWRHRKGGVHKGGGAHRFYTGTARDSGSDADVPTIGNGMDISAIVRMMMPHAMKMFEAMREGKPAAELDKDVIDAELARLPDKSDENLR